MKKLLLVVGLVIFFNALPINAQEIEFKKCFESSGIDVIGGGMRLGAFEPK